MLLVQHSSGRRSPAIVLSYVSSVEDHASGGDVRADGVSMEGSGTDVAAVYV
jgi:hypothetical protein